MTKHTPGPWYPSKGYQPTVTADKGQTLVAGNISASKDAVGGAKLAEIDANARLIAAAPDLLAACEAAVAALAMPSFGLGDEAFLKLATAIAKAKGS